MITISSGGVRSIIQLEILKSLEDVIGLEVPIQNFFDLIIGTRYINILSVIYFCCGFNQGHKEQD